MVLPIGFVPIWAPNFLDFASSIVEDKPLQASTPHDKISMTDYHWRNNDQGQNDYIPQENGHSDENCLAQEKGKMAHGKDIEHDNEVQVESDIDLCVMGAASGMLKTLHDGKSNGYTHLKLFILWLILLQMTFYQAETIHVTSPILILPYHGIPWTIPRMLYSKFRFLYCRRVKDTKTPSRESKPPDPEKVSELVDMKHSKKELSTDPVIPERISKANGRGILGFTYAYLDNKIVIPIMLFLLWMLLIVIPMAILPCKDPPSDIRPKQLNCLICIVWFCQRDIQKHFQLESVEKTGLCNGFPPALEEQNIVFLVSKFRIIIAILIEYYQSQCLVDKYKQNPHEHTVSDIGNCDRIHDRTTDIGGAEIFERKEDEREGESRDSSYAGPTIGQNEKFAFVADNDSISSNPERCTQYSTDEIGFKSTNGPQTSTEHKEIENVEPNDSRNRSYDELSTEKENNSRVDNACHNRSARSDHLDLDKAQNNEEHSENNADSHKKTNDKRTSEIHLDVIKKPERHHNKEHLFDTNVLECKEDHVDENKRSFTEHLPSSKIRNSEELLLKKETESTRKTDNTYGTRDAEPNCKYYEKTFSEERFEANVTTITVKLPFEAGTEKRGITLGQREEFKEECDDETPDFPGDLGDLENEFTYKTDEELLDSVSLDVDCCIGNDVHSSLTNSLKAIRRQHTDGCKKNVTTSGNPKFSKRLRMKVRSESNNTMKKILSPNGNDIDVTDQTRNYFTGNNQLQYSNHIRQLRDVTLIKHNLSNVRNRHLSSGLVLGVHNDRSETKAPLDIFVAIGVCSVTESMVYEWGRLKTFFNFPMNNPMMPVTLAKYGFYYTGDSDVVKCFSCNVSHGNWQKGDSVYAVHYQKSRRCRFMNGEDKRNVPIHGDEAASVDRRAGGKDISSRGTDGPEQNAILSTPAMVTSLFLELKDSKKADTTGDIQPTTSLQTESPNSSAAAITIPSPLVPTNPAITAKGVPNSHSSKMGSGDACFQQQPMNQQHPTTLDQRQQLRLEQNPEHQQPLQRQQEQTIVNGAATNFTNTEAAAARPRYPNYSSVTARAGTFNGFPNHLDQTPLVMAKAGFFYAGYCDYVRCFFCGGGLRNWEPGDDPWVEHARWFPRCTHVKQHKGQPFINLVLQRQRELTLPNEYISTPGQTPSPGQKVTIQTASAQTHNDRQTGASASITSARKQTESISKPNSRASTFGSPETTDQEFRQSLDMNSPAVRGLQDMGYDDRTIQTAIQRLRQNQGPEELSEPALMEIISSFNKQTGSCNIQGPIAQAKEIQNVEFKTPRSQIARPGLRGGAAANYFTDEELKSIQEENNQLKEQMKCKICMENDVCISFLPCGHLCCCAQCAPVMVKCPICRQIIKGSVKTFLS